MSQLMQYRFRIFGPNKGKTMHINGHPFVNGELTMVQSSAAMGACMNVLKFYGAFAYGTDEYTAALAAEEAESGGNDIHTEARGRDSEQVRGDVQSEPVDPVHQAPDVGGAHDPVKAGDEGVRSEGSGHGHAGVPKFEDEKGREWPSEPSSEVNTTTAKAVKSLDPDEDTHWVKAGVHAGWPKLSAVEEAVGRAGITRQDVEAAAPGWNRDKAVEAALAEMSSE